MIDTWLFTALILGIVALFVVLRGIPAKSRDDRLVAGTVAVILVSMAALVLSIGLGLVLILDGVILVSFGSFCVLVWTVKHPGASS